VTEAPWERMPKHRLPKAREFRRSLLGGTRESRRALRKLWPVPRGRRDTSLRLRPKDKGGTTFP
jgi:hypothetical protein